jgi:hypothetical protein
MTVPLLLIIIGLLVMDLHHHKLCHERTVALLRQTRAPERRIHRITDQAVLDMLDEVRRAWPDNDLDHLG